MSDSKKYYINNGMTITKGKNRINHKQIISYDDAVNFFIDKKIDDEVTALENATALVDAMIAREIYITDERFANSHGEVRDGSNPVMHTKEVIKEIDKYADEMEKQGATKEQVLEIKLQKFGIPQVKVKQLEEVSAKAYNDYIKEKEDKAKVHIKTPWRKTVLG